MSIIYIKLFFFQRNIKFTRNSVTAYIMYYTFILNILVLYTIINIV